ncbi:MAG: hypothetical protein IJ278_01555 [Clostridia bacterium]|nr:hypothetical protein [Clostridia bacterium]
MLKQFIKKWDRLVSLLWERKRSRVLFRGQYGVKMKPVPTQIVNPPAVIGIYPNVGTCQLCWIDLDAHPGILGQYYNEKSRLLPFLKALGNVVPVFCTDTYGKAVELLFRLKTEEISDCFIATTNLEILSACYQEYPKVGRVWCVSDDMEQSAIVKTAHSNRVNVICSKTGWSQEVVFYFKQRLLTVWQYAKGDRISLCEALVSGCRGVITEQPEAFASLLTEISQKTTIIGQPIIIGHRGISSNLTYMENTLTTAIESVKLGANVIDIDTRLTKDGRLIAFHGWTIDRILEGEGEVRSYTLSQLQKMKFRYGLNPEEKVLPLEEFFQRMMETFPHKHLMFTCEIGGDIVESVAKLKEILDRFPNLQDSLMVKCKNGKYGYSELKKQLPYLPVRNYLNDVISPRDCAKSTILHIIGELHQRSIPWCAKYRKFHKKLLQQLQLRSTIVIKLMQNTKEKIESDLFSGIELLCTDVNLLAGFFFALNAEKEVHLSMGETYSPMATAVGCEGATEVIPDGVFFLENSDICVQKDGSIYANKSGSCVLLWIKTLKYHNTVYQILSEPIKIIVK